jgi:cation diffusion facilitator family transporter
MSADHNHDHDDREASHGHSHGVVDPIILTTERGIGAIRASLWIFLLASLFEIVIAWMSGSVALLADAAHNLGDTCSSLPLWLAFKMARRKPTRRFTYGYGRLEDLGGLFVLALILASGVVAGWSAVHRLLHPQPVVRTAAVMLAAGISFAANEVVAWMRIKAGREIGSAALIADGNHARTDGLASLAVLCGAVAVRRGHPLADPIVGLLMVPMLLKLAWESGKSVVSRMIDTVEPEIVDEIQRVVGETAGVVGAADIRARWLGHRLLAEVSIAVEPDLSVRSAHEVALDARHRLLHGVKFLSDVNVHVCPMGALGESHRVVGHQHDGLPAHSH